MSCSQGPSLPELVGGVPGYSVLQTWRETLRRILGELGKCFLHREALHWGLISAWKIQQAGNGLAALPGSKNNEVAAASCN